jgi:hypothetical protein
MSKPVHIFVRDSSGQRVPNPQIEFNGVMYSGNKDGVADFEIWDGETHARYSVIKEGFDTKIIDTDIPSTGMYCESVTIEEKTVEPDIRPAKDFRVDGENLYNEDGVFRVQGISVFHDFYKWLNGNKNEELNKWARELGVNTKRVFGSGGYDNIDFNPYHDYDKYFSELPKYLEYQRAQGFCIEFTPLCRAEVFTSQELCNQFTKDISQVLSQHGHCWHNLVNEPYKNLPPGVTPQSLIFNVVEGAKYDLGAGPGEEIYTPIGDGITVHADRGDDWVRKARQAQEVREQHGCPVISDEPMGADSVNQPGSRSNVPTDFYQFHALGSQYYGNVIHFTAGRQGNKPTGLEEECVRKGAQAWKDVPVKFLDGNFLYITKNIPGEKSYGVELGNEGCAVIVHPDGSECIPEAGWKIVKNIENTVYLFERV